MLDARRPTDGQAVDVGPADVHGRGTERQRLNDVRAAPDAAVHHHGHAAVHGGDDFRQDLDRGRKRIEATAAVIGNYDAVGTCRDAIQGISPAHDAFEQ